MKRNRRHGRIRARVTGTKTKPRLSVFRSNRFIYAQLVDDASGLTLAAASDVSTANDKKTKVERAAVVGEAIAKKAIEKKIQEVVFDRGGFLYAGRVKALAESARKAGLTF